MSERAQNRLRILDKIILVMIVANVFIVALTVLNYVQDGKFSNLSIVVGLTSLSSLLIIRAVLARKTKS